MHPAPLGCLLSCFVLSACAARPESRELRVLCWNVHHGRGLDGRVDLDRIAALIRASRAQIVALQEVDRGVRRSGRIDIAAELARRLGMRWVFGKNLDFQGGDYGNALLTTLDVERSHNRHYAMEVAGEQRGCLVVLLHDRERRIGCIVTHLGTRRPNERARHAAEILEEVRRFPPAAPVVVAGDFNDRPGRPVHARLTKGLADAWEQAGDGPGYTYPVHGASRRIDWVLLTPGRGLTVAAARVLTSDASDHRAVLVTFR